MADFRVKFTSAGSTIKVKIQSEAEDFRPKFGSSGGTFKVEMQSDDDFRPRFGSVQAVTTLLEPDGWYKGEYEVTPKPEAQTLQTAQKTMINDVTVKAIPFFDVSNTAGGKTIYIGSEV